MLPRVALLYFFLRFQYVFVHHTFARKCRGDRKWAEGDLRFLSHAKECPGALLHVPVSYVPGHDNMIYIVCILFLSFFFFF